MINGSKMLHAAYLNFVYPFLFGFGEDIDGVAGTYMLMGVHMTGMRTDAGSKYHHQHEQKLTKQII